MNIFRQHKERTLAEKSARENAPATGDVTKAGGDIYGQMMVQLGAHKAELKKIQSIKAKVERKHEWLPEYMPYVEGVLTAGEAVQDDLVMTMFIWAIDTQDFATARDIADWALSNDIAPPPGFDRSTATIWAEEASDALLSDRDNASDPKWSDLLGGIAQQVSEHDIPDQVRAKLFKAHGLALTDNHPTQALDAFKAALDFDKNAGVKRNIDALERRLKPSPAPVLTPEKGAASSDAKPSLTESKADQEADAEAAKATPNEPA